MRAAILAGGAASRFGGRPKGLERIGGERILDRAVRTLQEVTGQLPALIANAPDATQWRSDLKPLKDPVPNCGSLSGLYTAVTAGEEPVLVVAWDMPFLPHSLLQALIAGAQGFDVFLPESGGRRGVEPLCAVYGPACGPAMRSQIDLEDFRAVGFHSAVNVGRLPFEEVAKHGDPEVMFFNVNTAEDLQKAEELWRRLG